MAEKQQVKYAAPMGEGLTLGDIIGTAEVALNQGLPMDSQVRIEYEQTFFRDFLTITHDPTRRRVTMPLRDNLTPVEQAIESGGDRLLEVGFVRHSDVRQPVTIRIQVSDDSTNIVMTSLELTEHQFALLLSGQVIKIKDSL